MPGLLPVVRQSNMEYALFPNNISRAHFPEYTNILTDYDLTGDGQQDLIIDIGSGAGGVIAHRLEVYSWGASAIVQLANIDAEDGKYAGTPQVEIDDYNEDGFSDIRVTHQKWMDLGCRYEEVKLYSWRGTEPQYSQTSNIEDKLECDAARAITQNLSSQSIYIGDVILSPENLSVDERITMLNRSLTNTTVETAPFVDYIALLRLHLAMAYQSKGENELALDTMVSINDLPHTPFVTAMQDTFLATEEDIVSTCRLMYQDEWFRTLDMNANDDLLAQLGMLRNYGYPTTALQRRMCPFPMVIAGSLERLSLPVNLSPEAAFAANHIEILFQHEFNIDEDPENEWLVIVESAAPQVVVLDAVGDTWQLYRLAELIPPVTDIQVQAITDTLDGNPVLLLQVTQNIYSWFCWGDQQTDILTIGLSEGVYELVDHTTACADDSLPIHSDNLDNNFYESPTDFFYNQQINQIEEMILSGERPFPDLQNELSDLIDTLPNNTPSRQLMHNRLLYLSGLTYELAGDDDQAVATYLDLIQQSPSSPWSWLAWARLAPVEG
ncbi:MAG: tetratricopeptide repeat protein [Anaerolineae bacterium]|nr:tetratricopeptide repeat protein [Anaerolineae bacterium]